MSRMVRSRAALLGAMACFAAACGGQAPRGQPERGPAPSDRDVRGLQQDADMTVFWLGRSFSGARLSAAEPLAGRGSGVILAYGPESCGDSGCTSELDVSTTLDRRPDEPEESCWHRLGGAWLNWCEGTDLGDLYVGSSLVSIFSVYATPEEVARAVRPFPGRQPKLPAAKRFSCREARGLPRGFRRTLPDTLRPRGC